MTKCTIEEAAAMATKNDLLLWLSWQHLGVEKLAALIDEAREPRKVELPPLPKPVHLFPTGKDRYPWGYTAGHVQQYALTALAAAGVEVKHG